MITITQVQQDMMAIEKRRRKDRDPEPRREEPLTPAHAAAEAMMDVPDGPPSGPAEKAIADRGATAGPGEGLQPGQIEPVRRGYLEQGHAARAPQSGPPNQSPMPDMARGVPTPIQVSPLPAISGSSYGPAAAGLAAHYARAAQSVPSARAAKGSTQ